MLDNQERRNNNNDNNGEDVNNNNVWQWFTEIPFVTRTYLVLSVATTMLCSIDYLSPLSLYFNARLIIVDGQYWRLFTNFLFFGLPGLDFVFHMVSYLHFHLSFFFIKIEQCGSNYYAYIYTSFIVLSCPVLQTARGHIIQR